MWCTLATLALIDMDSVLSLVCGAAPISSAPRLFWEGVEVGAYVMQGERFSIGCTGNVGYPPGTLEVWRTRSYDGISPELVPAASDSLTRLEDGALSINTIIFAFHNQCARICTLLSTMLL